MKHLFVPYHIAVIAKEKGFNEPCVAEYFDEELTFFHNLCSHNGKECNILSTYTNTDPNHYNKTITVSAPMYQQVVDWFREKHNHVIMVKKDWYDGKLIGWESIIEEQNDGFVDCGTFKTYNEALNKAIENALKLI